MCCHCSTICAGLPLPSPDFENTEGGAKNCAALRFLGSEKSAAGQPRVTSLTSSSLCFQRFIFHSTFFLLFVDAATCSFALIFRTCSCSRSRPSDDGGAQDGAQRKQETLSPRGGERADWQTDDCAAGLLTIFAQAQRSPSFQFISNRSNLSRWYHATRRQQGPFIRG